jgi:integrase
MASVWKHPQSQFWVACFTDNAGKQRKKSTKETNRKLALKMAEKLEGEYRKVRTANQMQKLLREAHREITGATLEQASLADYQPRWIASKKAEGCADATMVFYEHSTARFIAFLGSESKKPLSTITKEQVERFRNTLAETLATKTVNHQIQGLRMLFKGAVDGGLAADNPAESVKLIRVKTGEESVKEAFTIEQIRLLLPHCKGYWLGMVLLGVNTGQRLADIQHMKWSQVSADGGEISLVARKTKRPLSIPTSPQLRAYINSMPRPEDPQAFLHPGAAALAGNSLSMAFSKIVIKAGLRPRPALPSNATETPRPKRDHTGLSFHSLRHSAVTFLAEAGIPQAVNMALTGHSSAVMNAHYTKIGKPALALAAAAFPTI